MRLRECRCRRSSVVLATLAVLLSAAQAWAADLAGLLARPEALIGTPEEAELGRALHEELLASGRVRAAPSSPRGEAIFERLAAAARARRELPYRLTVLDSPEPDAFAGPGGFVYVTAGLVDLLDDAELAGVLGHELAHTIQSHALRQYVLLLQVAQLEDVVGQQSPSTAGAGNFFLLLLSRGYSRSQEEEADRLGAYLAARAGFDPAGLARALQRLAATPKPHRLEFFATHPFGEDRIRGLLAAAEQMRKGGLPPDSPPVPPGREKEGTALVALLLALLLALVGP